MNKSVRDIGLFVIGLSSLYIGLNLFIRDTVNQRRNIERRVSELVSVASDYIRISIDDLDYNNFMSLSTSCLPCPLDEIPRKINRLDELPTKKEYSVCLGNKVKEYLQNRLEIVTNPDSQEYKRLVSLLDRLN